MFDRPSLARIAPFATYILFIAIADLFTRLGWSVMELRWLYPLKITLIIALLWFWRREYVELAWPPGRNARSWIIAVAVGIVVFVAWINLGADWMKVAASSSAYHPLGPDGQMEWGLIAVRLAGAALVVPVMEELFWRSFLLRWLVRPDFLQVNPASVGVKAFAITAVLFAVEHNLWLAGLIAGIAYNALYVRSRTIWFPLLAHGVTNGILGVWVIVNERWDYW
ncbi:CAAX prenyl protease-related protein [Actimicrobium sp. CCI2.3]|uniref:CAAX prenyl protease-related protein n=1 Tax=Actimicrobium sp. CCI2.3 TaxID=3048616 RepID=UPI002AB4EA28|nr:CAAX prenyl protease-related protein [Actimicrobium sp. CCI2.3]MDY7576641.1 CAAX prenyl protease-related protein [Actimicrobium sp. CCI2.3]MEB0021242.1 CAAX prenyl protease-related protein [Actimicrobium sp. CCI2.3]